MWKIRYFLKGGFELKKIVALRTLKEKKRLVCLSETVNFSKMKFKTCEFGIDEMKSV